jgi:hypothetical protein
MILTISLKLKLEEKIRGIQDRLDFGSLDCLSLTSVFKHEELLMMQAIIVSFYLRKVVMERFH